MLRLFLEWGSAIDAPFHQSNPVQTLLDHALLNGDEDVRQIFNSLPAATSLLARQMSMWGIINHTEMGRDQLESYLRTTPAPPGTTARDIQDAALSWAASRARTAAILTMIQTGFDARLLISAGRYQYLLKTESQSNDNYLNELFRDTPLTELSSELALALLRDYRGSSVEYALIEACLSSKYECVARFLFRHILDLTDASSRVMILSYATRLSGRAAVSSMKKLYPEAFTETAQFWNFRSSPLLLSAARLDTRSSCPRLLAGTQPASVEMLKILQKEGADISSCHPCFWTHQYWIDGEQLQWLVNQLAGKELSTGISAYSVMLPSMRRMTSDDQAADKILEQIAEQDAMERSILESLHDLRISICSPSELVLLRDYRNFETDVHPLSFFISRKLKRELMDRALESGIDVNGTGKLLHSDTPIMAAVRANDFHLVQALVSRGARPRHPGYHHAFTALQLTCGVRNFEPSSGLTKTIRLGAADFRIVEYLLKQGADTNERGYYCCISPLQLTENPLIVQLLLGYGASAKESISRCYRCDDLQSRNWPSLAFMKRDSMFRNMGMEAASILHFAVSRSTICGTEDARRIVRMLIENGANINQRSASTSNGPGCSVLEIAAGVDQDGRMGTNGDIEMVRQLLDLKAEVNPPPDHKGPSALTAACHHQDVSMVRLLLKRGANPNQPINFSSLSTAAGTGNLLVVIMLLVAGAEGSS